MRGALAALLVVTAVVAGAASGAHAKSGVRTLVTTSGRITAFAQDGRYLAWAATGRSCGQAVSLYDTSRRRTMLLTRPGTPGCRMEAPVAQLAVATQGAQARALWSRYETGNNYYHWLFAGSTQQPRERDAGLISESTGDELRVSIAGDGPFLGLGWAHATEDLDANLPYTILDGGVKRLGSDLRLTVVPGMPAVAALAAGGGNVALVPRGTVGATTSPRAVLRDVQVRSAASLELRATATASGSVFSVAVSGSRLVARRPVVAETFSLDGQPLPARGYSVRGDGCSHRRHAGRLPRRPLDLPAWPQAAARRGRHHPGRAVRRRHPPRLGREPGRPRPHPRADASVGSRAWSRSPPTSSSACASGVTSTGSSTATTGRRRSPSASTPSRCAHPPSSSRTRSALAGRLDGLDESRARWLRAQLTGIETVARRFAGEEIAYADEVERCYGVRPQRVPEDVFEAAHRALDDLLPGTGPVRDRYLAWREADALEGDRLRRVVAGLGADLRARAAAALGLPEGEEVVFEYVGDEPWAAFNYYEGGLRSRIAVNTDLPLPATRAVELVAHETYPGHHTERAWKEQRLVRERGYLEESILMIGTPQALDRRGHRGGRLTAAARRRAGRHRGGAPRRRRRRLRRRARPRGQGGGPSARRRLRQRGAPAPRGRRERRRSHRVPRAVGARDRSAGASERRFATDPVWRSYVTTYADGERLVRELGRRRPRALPPAPHRAAVAGRPAV